MIDIVYKVVFLILIVALGAFLGLLELFLLGRDDDDNVFERDRGQEQSNKDRKS